MIIAVDYDGTLFDGGTFNTVLLKRLRASQKRGDTVILWTCREGKSLAEALASLQGIGFRPNFVNCNCPEGVQRMRHDSRKIFADVYIDDKAVKA